MQSNAIQCNPIQSKVVILWSGLWSGLWWLGLVVWNTRYICIRSNLGLSFSLLPTHWHNTHLASQCIYIGYVMVEKRLESMHITDLGPSSVNSYIYHAKRVQISLHRVAGSGWNGVSWAII